MSGRPLSQLLGAPTASLSASSHRAADETIVAAVSPKRKIAATRDIPPSILEADVLDNSNLLPRIKWCLDTAASELATVGSGRQKSAVFRTNEFMERALGGLAYAC